MNFLQRFLAGRNSKGFMSAEWSIAVAVLLVPSFVVAISLPQLPARKSLSEVASAAAARAYVEVLDQGLAVRAARTAAADVILDEMKNIDRDETTNENQERQLLIDSDDFGIKIELNTAGNNYCPGNEVTVLVSLPIPVVLNPFNSYGRVNSGAKISSTATERIPDFAEVNGTDVEDPARCPDL